MATRPGGTGKSLTFFLQCDILTLLVDNSHVVVANVSVELRIREKSAFFEEIRPKFRPTVVRTLKCLA